MIRIGLIAGLLLGMASPAAAQSFFERYLAERNGAATCYARPAEDARSSRRRRIQELFVSHARDDRLKPPRTFEVAFGFTIAGSSNHFASKAGCETVGQLARCVAAADAGAFTLAPEGEALKLTIGGRLVLQGEQGFSPNLADGGNELIFILQPSAAANCSFE